LKQIFEDVLGSINLLKGSNMNILNLVVLVDSDCVVSVFFI